MNKNLAKHLLKPINELYSNDDSYYDSSYPADASALSSHKKTVEKLQKAGIKYIGDLMTSTKQELKAKGLSTYLISKLEQDAEYYGDDDIELQIGMVMPDWKKIALASIKPKPFFKKTAKKPAKKPAKPKKK